MILNISRNYLNNENQTFLLMRKYENAKVLSLQMQEKDYRLRPSCEQILKEREKWAINESEFNLKEELNILLELADEKNYIQNMILKYSQETNNYM
jgi:hypothetical protein